MAKDTTVTGSFRASSIENLDQLGNRRRSIEESMRALEEEARTAIAEHQRATMAALAKALEPLEEDLRDTNNAIYATERMLGALPPVEPRFQGRDDTETERPGETQEADEAGRGLSDSQANG